MEFSRQENQNALQFPTPGYLSDLGIDPRKVKEENEKAGLKLNIQKTKIIASGPTTSWEIDGETVETVSDFIFLGSKIIVDGDCSLESRRCLLLGRKGKTKPRQCIKKAEASL